MNTDRLTTYFQHHHAWIPPWHKIRLVREGWALRAGSILCRDNNATTIALPGRYEVHYREPLQDTTLAHELQHIRDMERMGKLAYIVDYAREILRVGYRKNKYEVEARCIAFLYCKEVSCRK